MPYAQTPYDYILLGGRDQGLFNKYRMSKTFPKRPLRRATYIMTDPTIRTYWDSLLQVLEFEELSTSEIYRCLGTLFQRISHKHVFVL